MDDTTKITQSIYSLLLPGINKHQDSWKATYYDRYVNLTLGDMRRRAGGKLWKRVWPDVSPTDERTRQGRNKKPLVFWIIILKAISLAMYVRQLWMCEQLSDKLHDWNKNYQGSRPYNWILRWILYHIAMACKQTKTPKSNPVES